MRRYLCSFLILVLFIAMFPVQSVRAGTRYYVKTTGNDANSGTSWEQAYATLSKALSVAAVGDEIWVAQGTYYPNYSRESSLAISGESVYGGFAGWETSLGQRNIAANLTVLSGDYQKDSDATNNAYHVVSIATSYPAVLDGFTITGGYANGGLGSQTEGGGIYISSGVSNNTVITLRNLVVTGNFANGLGGGIAVSLSNGVQVLDSTISSNTANNGAGIALSSSNASINNVTISNNTANNGGGGIYTTAGFPVLNNVTVANNTATSIGGGIYLTGGGGITALNTTIAYNSSPSWGSGVYIGVNTASQFTNVIIGKNTNNSYQCARIGSPQGTVYAYNTLVETSGAAACGIVNGSNGNITGVDPKLGALINNGGSTLTIAPLQGSPAIDAGNTTNYTNPDQRGISRPQDGDNNGSLIPDIGAVEFVLDSTPPQIASIVRAGSDPTNASQVVFTVNFTESVTGVDTSDFQLTTSGVSGASIASVSGSGAIYSVTVNTGTGNGTIRLDVKGTATIQDTSGNGITGVPYTSGQSYTIDKTAPLVTGITRSGTSPTNASQVQFAVTFSESVTGVDAGDFSLTVSGITGASVASVSGSGSSYTVTVNTGSGDGTLRLDIPSNATITDLAGNALGNKPYTGGESYTMDKTRPQVVSVTRLDSARSRSQTVRYQVVFSEPVIGLTVSDFDVLLSGTLNGVQIISVTGSGDTWIVTIDTGTGSGTIRLKVK